MLTLPGHTKPIRCLAYSPDGRLLATGCGDGRVRLWNPATGKEVATNPILPLRPSPALDWMLSVEAVAFRADGKSLVAGTALGDGCVLSGSNWKETKRIRLHEGGVRHLVCLSDGQILSAGTDGQVYCWDGDDKILRVFDCGPPMTALAATPDGAWVVAGDLQGDLDISRGLWAKKSTPLKPEHPIHAAVFNEDGSVLAYGSADGIICLWDTAKKKKRATLKGHTWTIYGLAFTPDGKQLLSGSADGTVRLWDVESAHEIRAYRWHSSWVTCLAVSPDGLTAAAGSNDHTVVIWDLDES